MSTVNRNVVISIYGEKDFLFLLSFSKGYSVCCCLLTIGLNSLFINHLTRLQWCQLCVSAVDFIYSPISIVLMSEWAFVPGKGLVWARSLLLNKDQGMEENITNDVIDRITDTMIKKLTHSRLLAFPKGDLTIAQVQHILGCGRSAAYDNRYHGEYRHNGRRMVRREEFMYRRAQGLDVCITK